jgi:transcriptional regulator with XRE-family HTH domain
MHLKVENIFQGDNFDDFRDYCKEHNYILISELTLATIKEFKVKKQISNIKYHKIITKLEEIQANIDTQLKFKELMKAELCLLQVDEDFSEKNFKIKDFLTTPLEKLYSVGFSSDSLHKILSTILEISTLENILELVNTKIKSFHKEVLISRLIKNMTLKDIGIEMGVSKERIRQIEKASTDKIFNILLEQNFIRSLKITHPKIGYSLKELKKILGEKNRYIFELLKAKDLSEDFYYMDKLEFFSFKNEIFSKESYIEMLKKLPVAPKFYFGEELRSLWEDFLVDYPHFTEEMGKTLAKNFGYTLKNGYAFKHLNQKEKVEIFFKEFIHAPKIITENTVDELLEDIFEIFDEHLFAHETEDLPTRYTNFKAIVYRIPEIINVGTSTFFHITKLDYDYPTLVEFKDKILEECEEYLDIRYIFTKYIDECKEFGAYNEHILYSLFKYHFHDEFNYNKNTYILFKQDHSNVENLKLDRVKVIEEFIENHGKSIQKYDLSDALSYRIQNINSALEKSNRLLMMDLNEIGLIDFIKIDEETKRKLQQLIEEYKNTGFFTVTSVCRRMKSNPIFNDFFQDNKVNKYLLSSYIKYLAPEWKGNANILFYGEPSVKNLSDYSMMHFHGFESFKLPLLSLFLRENGASHAGVGKIIKSLLENNKLIQLNETDYKMVL